MLIRRFLCTFSLDNTADDGLNAAAFCVEAACASRLRGFVEQVAEDAVEGAVYAVVAVHNLEGGRAFALNNSLDCLLSPILM